MTADVLPELVAYAADLAGRLPGEVAARAGLLAADTIGVTLAGGRRPEAERLVAGDGLTGSWRRSEPGDRPAATLLVAGGGYADPERAAYANATASCALELDEGVRPTGHPSAHVLPAALAAGEALGSRWRDVVRAYVAGYEVAAGLFTLFGFRGQLHPHGHLGGIGAAVAVATLAGTDPLRAAYTAAALPLLTTWPTCVEGSDVRNAWIGHAASTGLTAHRLAAAGYTGSRSALAAAFDGLVADRRPGVPVVPARAYLLGGYVKVYSACALTHGSIEAAASLAPVDGDAVESVEVAVGASGLRLAQPPADTPLGRRFSVPYAVAVALLHGGAPPERFDVPDPRALALAERVRLYEDHAATRAWPERAPAGVVLRLAGGDVRRATCAEPRGHPGAPVGADEMAAKFRTLTGHDDAVWTRLTDPSADTPTRDMLAGLIWNP
ncbi:MAG: hypothetical protein GEV10_30880 [Streptosporangiales bacterium]|nr:hypothetical protein [Streptosporangiales bacterium]